MVHQQADPGLDPQPQRTILHHRAVMCLPKNPSYYLESEGAAVRATRRLSLRLLINLIIGSVTVQLVFCLTAWQSTKQQFLLLF